MPTPDEIKVIFEKLTAGTATDEDIEILRQAYEGSERISFQYGNSIVNIGQGKDIHIGDLTYQTIHAEVIRKVFLKALEEHPKTSNKKYYPDLPPHFIRRTQEIERLKQLITPKKQTDLQSSHKVGVHGMAGIGKTVLASALVRDKEVQQQFSDGVFWLDMRQENSLHELQLQGLQDKACLIVLDDVSRVEQVKAFNDLGEGCCLLFTTCDARIITDLGAVEYKLNFFNNEQALDLLAKWVGQEVETLPNVAREVAKQCDYLPLALSLCGAQIKDGMRWKSLRDALQETKLKRLNRPGGSIYQLLKISIDALADENKTYAECYRELCIFPSGSSIPEAALATLWQKTHHDMEEPDVDFLIIILTRKDLLRRTGNAAEQLVSMHNLLYKYLRSLVSDSDLKALNEEFLAAYWSKSTNGWHTVPDDGYFFKYLAYHLFSAGRETDLRELLLDFNWLQKKLEIINTYALIADFNYLLDDVELRLIQKALVLSAHILEQDRKQLWSQLQGRLMRDTSTTIETLLQQKPPFPLFRTLTPSLHQADTALLRIFTGHSDHVKTLAVSADGKYVLSGSSDTSLKLWNLNTGEQICTLDGHNAIIYTVKLIPERMQAISGAADGSIKLWDLEKQECIHTFKENTSSVYTVALIPERMQAISGTADGNIKLWDLEKREYKYTLRAHEASINALAVLPEQMQAISASSDSTLKLWDLENRKCIGTFQGHQGAIQTVAVLQKHKQVISGSAEGILKLWNLENFECLHTFKAHEGSICSVIFLTDQMRVVSSSTDKTLKLWNLKQRNCELILKDSDWANAVAIIPTSEDLIAASDDYTLKLWSLSNQKSKLSVERHNDTVRALAVTADGKQAIAISASEDKTLKLWNIGSGKCELELTGHHDIVTALALTPDGKQAVSTSLDGKLKVWDLRHKTNSRCKLTIHQSLPATSIAFITNSEESILIASDNILWLINLNDLECNFLPEVHSDMITDLAVTADGRQAISASKDGTLRLWDLKNGECKRVLETQAKTITAIAMTPDGKWVVCATNDNNLKLWNLHKEEDKYQSFLFGHTDWINALAITADGKRAISSSYDKTHLPHSNCHNR
ncbi:NB-ARC domain-containing protein [Mastigocoleus testarum]|uniref:Uncharacterized protein n=1 Tax=Mastigocoleus testarum BC008 TaxID=371196 RepID=A0A0V7ZUM1_9CYAN|nr:NB-ARC domain-containing protein [Mastigocoleus testarum]KST68055.1 hypothetical protein BC008_32260 [Mastigocoleus testarum BC008]KST68321.1 hypothetical protein BC008_32870 [Mastigocoleus testarum BC008]